MSRYVGLTFAPEIKKKYHGNPPDWKVEKEFTFEAEARAWEKEMLKDPNYKSTPDEVGWTYGYTYTITPRTLQ